MYNTYMHAQALHTTVVQPRTPAAAAVAHLKMPVSTSAAAATAKHSSGINSSNSSSSTSGCCAKCAPLLQESNLNMLKLRIEVDGIISDVAAAQSKDARQKQVNTMYACRHCTSCM
jgi:hypothetical protein